MVFIFLFFIGIFNGAEFFSLKAEQAKATLQEFDSLIEQAMSDYRVPGLAVGVVVDGQVVYAKGFGFRDVEAKLPVTKETLFAIGSGTKAFTTFVMGNLVDEGKIQWDQPVIDVLPEFRLSDHYATTNLTIRDLLTHRTGMPRHEFVWYNSKATKNEMLKRIRYLQPSFDIRERYQYNNLMYFIAGLAMEQATGKTWEELIKAQILLPLEMARTNFSVEDTQKTDNYAFPYLEKNERLKKIPFRNISLISAAGALNSNVEEMTHWITMLLAGGVYKNKALINPTTLQELQAPQVIVPGAPETKETLLYAYGLGWAVNSYRGYYLISHDCISDGFTSVIGCIPSENIGVVVLANKNMTALPRYLSFEMIDRILNLSRHDWFKEGIESLRKNKESTRESKLKEDRMRKKGTSPCHPLEDYVGLYEHPGYGELSIELVNGKLEATYNDLTFVLDHWHYDVFAIAQEKQDMIVSLEGMKFTFCNNPNGDIGEVVVPFEPTAGNIIFTHKTTHKDTLFNYLRQFAGVYEIYGYTVEIAVRNGGLVAIIPGQPNYELIPAGENEFTVKTMTGSTVRFVMDREEHVEEVLLIHPYGAFSAMPKK